MRKSYTIIPPQQKYMTVSGIYEAFGTRPVIAYNCIVEGGIPQGGYVIAVQNELDTPTSEIKHYMSQLKKKYSSKEPIYYMRAKLSETGSLRVSFSDGKKKDNLPSVNAQLSTEEKTADLPDKDLARAVSTALKSTGGS